MLFVGVTAARRVVRAVGRRDACVARQQLFEPRGQELVLAHVGLI